MVEIAAPDVKCLVTLTALRAKERSAIRVDSRPDPERLGFPLLARRWRQAATSGGIAAASGAPTTSARHAAERHGLGCALGRDRHASPKHRRRRKGAKFRRRLHWQLPAPCPAPCPTGPTAGLTPALLSLRGIRISTGWGIGPGHRPIACRCAPGAPAGRDICDCAAPFWTHRHGTADRAAIIPVATIASGVRDFSPMAPILLANVMVNRRKHSDTTRPYAHRAVGNAGALPRLRRRRCMRRKKRYVRLWLRLTTSPGRIARHLPMRPPGCNQRC
ncbi:hypothetical protein CLV78_1011017 [Aliiruegeria haliotis]|uniref:Uncharacterized protein n=1 Tax=Aliiruegeria haliotis TaxID=1280846 RepID=A0A2T0S0L7_9RHOB|nr:hypothetical protein CLV78_1011017 [Aliiruegeria haliotis]